jgi:hypothetical protein
MRKSKREKLINIVRTNMTLAIEASGRDYITCEKFKNSMELTLEAVDMVLEGKRAYGKFEGIAEKVIEQLKRKDAMNRPAKAFPHNANTVFLCMPRLNDRKSFQTGEKIVRLEQKEG